MGRRLELPHVQREQLDAFDLRPQRHTIARCTAGLHPHPDGGAFDHWRCCRATAIRDQLHDHVIHIRMERDLAVGCSSRTWPWPTAHITVNADTRLSAIEQDLVSRRVKGDGRVLSLVLASARLRSSLTETPKYAHLDP
eukprot:SAG31_NODE_5559_length_2458_cov_3.930479_4_plen_139_part_00